MHVRTSFVGTWEVFILPRQSNRGRRGKEDSVSDGDGMKKSDEAVVRRASGAIPQRAPDPGGPSLQRRR